jgi:hypothetical protein
MYLIVTGTTADIVGYRSNASEVKEAAFVERRRMSYFFTSNFTVKSLIFMSPQACDLHRVTP